MGCCGCDNRSSANTAGIFAIVQCIVGIILAIYNLSIVYGDCFKYTAKGYLCYTLFEVLPGVRALLIVVLIIYIIWIVSSIVLLYGNSNNRSTHVRQWVIISTIIIVCDVVLPAILLGISYGKIIDNLTQSIYDRYDRRTITYTSSEMNLTWNYLVLAFTFSRGGLITWICDICLTVYTSRRASEIDNPPATYIYTQPVVGMVTGGFPVQQQQQYYAPGFVAQPQTAYYPNQPQYPQAAGQFQYAAPPPAYNTDEQNKF